VIGSVQNFSHFCLAVVFFMVVVSSRLAIGFSQLQLNQIKTTASQSERNLSYVILFTKEQRVSFVVSVVKCFLDYLLIRAHSPPAYLFGLVHNLLKGKVFESRLSG